MICKPLRRFLRDVHRCADALEGIEGNYALRIVFGIGTVSEQTAPPRLTPNAERSPKGEVLVMLKMTSSQKATCTVAFKDKKGHPAPVDGSPIWGVDNSELVSIVPSEDGLSCEVSAVGPLGTALVSVQADADMGEGIVPVAGTLEVELVSGAATVVEITAGEPTEQE